MTTTDGAREESASAAIRPAPTSAAVGLVVTALVLALLVAGAPLVRWPAFAGIAGGVTLAATIHALGRWPQGHTGTFLAGLGSIAVGWCLVLALLGGTLVTVGALFPVPTAADVPPASLRVVGLVGLIAGCATAAFGAAQSRSGPLDATALSRLSRVTLRAGIVPVGAGGALLLLGVTIGQAPSAGSTAGSDPVSALSTMLAWLLAPSPASAMPVGFFLLCLLAVLGLRGVVTIRSRPAGDAPLSHRVATIRRALTVVAVGIATLLAVAVPVTLLGPAATLRGSLGDSAHEGIRIVTTAPILRLALAGLAAGTLGPLLVRGGRARLSALAGQPRRALAAAAGPYFAGGAVLVVAAVVARQAVTLFRSWVAGALPGRLGGLFGSGVDRLVVQFGALTLVLLLVSTVVAATVLLLAVLRLLGWAVDLSPATAGPAFAATGLFVAAGFAGATGADGPVVIAALVGAVLVWDAGHFGTTLVRETGRGARPVEGLHLTATLLVAIAGAAVALGTVTLLGGGVVPGGRVGVATLAAVLGGLVLLVTALR